MRRIALYAFCLVLLGAILPLACTQDFNQFEPSGGTGAAGSTSSTSSSSGGACTDAMKDCPASGTTCLTVSCVNKKCAGTDTAESTPCTDNSGTVCDGDGHCVACVAATDCAAQSTLCITNTCTGNACGTLNAATGAACTDNGGKVCDGNGHCLGCNSTSDCTGTNICTGGTCVAATCSDGMKDGDETDTDCGGSCPPCANTKNCNGGGDCTSGYCNNGTCAPCSGDGNCTGSTYCSNSVCTAQQANGQACTATDQCSSGFCTDGFCCNMACGGTCQACSSAAKGAGSDGVCGDIKVGTDPKNQCMMQSMTSCGRTGSCDGNGACQDYPSGTPCGMAGCNGGEISSARTCDGSGNCQAATMTSCFPYANCAGNVCASSCAGDGDCSNGYYCNGMDKCVVAQTSGQACTGGDGNQCASGFCVDSVCCATQCNGPCNVCGGANGTCGNATSGTACMNGGNAGVCTGAGGTAAFCVQCVGNANCAGVAGKPACNTTNNTCVQCTAASMGACTGTTAVCDTTSDTCVQCATGSTSACTGTTPVCDTANDAEHDTCVACNVNTDCTSNMCNTTAHTCM